MKTQELIYARVKLQNPPTGKRLHISKDCTQIFYYNNKEKKCLIDNKNFIMKQNFDFMPTRIVPEGSNGWYKILIDINMNKLNEIFKCPYNINGRKNLFDIFHKCYQETKNNYTSHIILNLYENLLTKENKTEFTTWFNLKETTDKTCYYLPNNVYQIGDYHINTLNGQFLREIEPIKCVLNGGIIYDETYSWIENILKCDILRYDKKNNLKNKNKYSNLTLMHTKCIMIICDKTMCTYWVSKIKSYFPTAIIRVINTVKDHKNLTYIDLLEIDFLVVNYDYLVNKKYMSVLDDYNLNNITLAEIINIIRNEFQLFDNIKDKNDVFLSLITWNRIIIDCPSFNSLLKDEKGFELIMTMKSISRWVQLSKMPCIQNEYLMLYKFLFADDNVNFPLYCLDDMTTMTTMTTMQYINDIMYTFNTKVRNVVEEYCIIVKSSMLEKNILKFLENIKCTNTYKFHDTINILSKNIIGRQTYVNMLENLNLDAEFDNLQCPICFNEVNQEEMLFTSCGHHYCIACILESLEYNNSCPMCRHDLELQGLHYVDDICKNNKTVELIRTIRKIDDRVCVYINNLSQKRYLINYLKDYGLNDIEWIHNDLCQIQKTINAYENRDINIIFYDIYDDIDKLKHQLKLNNYNSIKIHYLIYDILRNKDKIK